MKLRTCIAVAAVAVFAACGTPYQATDTGTLVVSSDARNAFYTQYPAGSNVVWATYDANTPVLYDWEMTGWSTLDASDYVVTFTMDNENYYAWYDMDGTWVGSAYVVRDYNTMPAIVNTSITQLYPGYTIAGVNREYHRDRNLYEVKLKKTSDDSKMVILIDNDGNVVKSKVK